MVWPGAPVLSAVKVREEEAILSLPFLALHIHTDTHTQIHTQIHRDTHRETHIYIIHTDTHTNHTHTDTQAHTITHTDTYTNHTQTQTDTQNYSQAFCKFIFSLFLEELTS